MTINKKIIHFDKKEDFENKNNAGEILEHSIVFIEDANEIYTHGTEYQWVGWSVLTVPIPEGYSLYEAEDGTFHASDGPFYILEDEL